MARTPEFEREAVVQQAMAVFWERGYGQTSVGDLVNATGLNPGSLYAAFGSKKGVFLEVLEEYNRSFLSKIRALGGGNRPALHDLYRFLQSIVDDTIAGRDRRGCLSVNALLEMSQHDVDIASHLSRHNQKIETALSRVLTLAQAQGDIEQDKDIRGLAAFLVNNLWGMRVMCKARPDRTAMLAVVDGIMAGLTAEPKSTLI